MHPTLKTISPIVAIYRPILCPQYQVRLMLFDEVHPPSDETTLAETTLASSIALSEGINDAVIRVQPDLIERILDQEDLEKVILHELMHIVLWDYDEHVRMFLMFLPNKLRQAAWRVLHYQLEKVVHALAEAIYQATKEANQNET